ncbi:MAG: ATP-binding protein [Gammaproteobacteria bacterium]|nr:ATP-binding protein [Gammaproteobacteria bacterium]MBU1465997.1 ATP-binding protein [Gammaproteobacteria bacterium]MBU2238675.1 ATP-binding protein [Gammaproteobacteria bacterium]MBU2317644.1 ATP-binding protein [Gammaproteobacteria bacterium]MBU2414204.1 ATP-binding protein [Gammaproteobacteria bacterium]
MSFISSFEFNGKIITLTYPDMYYTNENSYTLITGKNGSGKSRFLSRLTNHLIGKENPSSLLYPNILNHSSNRKIISISTTPFDKFPTKSKNENYTYVGIKNHQLSSSSLKLIDSISKNLIKKHLDNEEDFKNQIPKILNSIGFENHLKVILKLESSSKTLSRLIDSLIENSLQKDMNFASIYNKGEVNYGINPSFNNELIRLERLTKNIDIETLKAILEAIKAIEHIKGDSLFSINLINDYQSELFFEKDLFFENSLKVLLKYNFLKISDLKLLKKDYGEMSLRRASSGEQCLTIIMLGIAANIEDNSIIMIDEPEVSLHPKWQEDFMPTLMNTFSIYSACQFIIATHSPQIVSGMKGQNCYVTDIMSQKLYTASFFSGKSADFQLAEIFGSPGQMNEYISRLCFNLLAKMKTHKKFEDNDKNEYQHLLSLKEKINKDDPILDLILVLEEVVQHYASNK